MRFAFISQTQDDDRNPFSYNLRRKAIRESYKGFASFSKRDIEGIIDPYMALEFLAKQGFTDIVFIVGQDRIDSFQTMHKYTEKFGIKKLKIVSAGWRDATADDITGVSSSKIRELLKGHSLGFLDVYNYFPPKLSGVTRSKFMFHFRKPG